MHPYKTGVPALVREYIGGSAAMGMPLQEGRVIEPNYFHVYTLEEEKKSFHEILSATLPTVLLIGSFS